jgi:hypothetical protein
MERNHPFLMSILSQLYSMRTHSMKVLNRKHWHRCHSLAKHTEREREKVNQKSENEYLIIDIFYQFIQIFKPQISIFIMKIATHRHYDVISSKATCLEYNLKYNFLKKEKSDRKMQFSRIIMILLIVLVRLSFSRQTCSPAFSKEGAWICEESPCP